MARTKGRPRVALPSPEPEERLGAALVMGNANVQNVSASNQISNGEVRQHLTNPISSKLSITRLYEQHSSIEPRPATQQSLAKKSSTTEQPSTLDPQPNGTDLTCPQCDSQFPYVGIKDFREHVESCTGRITVYSESTTSSLSPPPESQNGDNVADADDELDHLEPYDFTAFTSYPEPNLESKATAAADDVVDGADALPIVSDAQLKSADAQPESADTQPKSADAQLESADARPESADARPESADAQPESTDHQQKSADAQPESADAQPESADHQLKIADAQPKINFPRITDISKFGESFEGGEDLPYEDLYRRVVNAQKAMTVWQNEWIELDKFIHFAEFEVLLGKEHKNPRLPKQHLTGVGYQDQLESFVYGYEHSYHHDKKGNQNPIAQRMLKGSGNRRQLRQRVPTQKAMDADLSTSPDSDEGIGGRRRGRRQKFGDDAVDIDMAGGRGSRFRNVSSRFDSESRGQTPQKTFSSGKKVGRPRKNQVAGGFRLQELQFEHESQNGDTPEPAVSRASKANFDQRPAAIKRAGYGINHALQSTEQWDEDTDEMPSRPGTSGSTMTDASTDDMRSSQVRSSNRIRKRQNTSDFEDALPYSKRIGRKATNVQANGFNGAGVTQSQNDGHADRGWATRRTRPEDSNQPSASTAVDEPAAEPKSKSEKMKDVQLNSWAKDDGTRRKKQSELAKQRWAQTKASGLTTLAGNASSSTQADLTSTKTVAKDSLSASVTQGDGKPAPKVSAASLNMKRRWAAKKEAEALGLPVPKIGRYPKGGSAPAPTPDAAGNPDQIDAIRGAGNRKRKRVDEDRGASGIGDTAALEPPVKRRGGRPKKVVTSEPASNPKPTSQHFGTEDEESGIPITDDEEAKGKQPATVHPLKRRGGRPRKTDSEARPASPNGATVTGDNTAVSTKVAQPFNEDNVADVMDVEGSAQPQQPRTSGRVRRQTSAAASSQPGTRRSSRSSQKMTMTPTPAPTLQVAGEMTIKQESAAGPAMPKKRGRRPKSTNTGNPPDAIVSTGHAADDELSIKTRRGGRQPKDMSAESTPAPLVAGDVQSTPQEQPTKRMRGAYHPRNDPVANTPAAVIVSDAQTTPEELPIKRKRGGRPRKNANVDSASEPILVSEDAVDGVQEPPAKRRRVLEPEKPLADDKPVTSEPAEGDEPKKKRKWGGFRPKGGFAVATRSSSVAALTTTTDAEPNGEEDGSLSKRPVAFDNVTQEPPKKNTWGGFRPRKSAPTVTAPAENMRPDEREAGIPSNANLATGSAAEQSPKKRKHTWGGYRPKGGFAALQATAPDPALNTKNTIHAQDTRAEPEHEDYDSEATAKAKKAEASRKSKSEKMSAHMKARWKSGQMGPVMAKKRADNLARKAAAAKERAIAANAQTEDGEDVQVAPASAPTKRKGPPIRNADPGPKRRRTMNATMDGAADTDNDYDMATPSTSGPPFTGRKLSEYEHFQQLATPSRSAHGKRPRRPAALRASQSFSKFTDDGDDDEEAMSGDYEEDVETEIKKQFDSEYDRFKSLTSPAHIPGILMGKRKRKPVINLEEAMRIEAGDDDDSEE